MCCEGKRFDERLTSSANGTIGTIEAGVGITEERHATIAETAITLALGLHGAVEWRALTTPNNRSYLQKHKDKPNIPNSPGARPGALISGAFCTTSSGLCYLRR